MPHEHIPGGGGEGGDGGYLRIHVPWEGMFSCLKQEVDVLPLGRVVVRSGRLDQGLLEVGRDASLRKIKGGGVRGIGTMVRDRNVDRYVELAI